MGNVDVRQSIEEYVNGEDWRIKQNANTGYSFPSLVNNVAGKVMANYWLDYVYTVEEGGLHREGDFHIHDLDGLAPYCMGWDLRALLNEGFNGVPARTQSNAPKHLQSALGQMVNFLGILQGEAMGAMAFSSFDTYLAPLLFKDDLSYEEVEALIEGFIYNLNVPSRWGQSPFTNVTIDWTVPQDLAEQIPMANNKHLFADIDDEEFLNKCKERGVDNPEEMKYKHFQKEMNMINKAFYTVHTRGDAMGQPFTFPIPTINITEDFDWDGENVDLLFENTAKRGTSYFQNFIGSQYKRDEDGNLVRDEDAYKPEDVRSMCCRLQLDKKELRKRGGGLFGSDAQTGSIGVVTLNMARLGYMFKGSDLQGVYKRLEYLLNNAKNVLEKKRAYIQEQYERGLYPYTKRYLHSFRNHFSTIGVNGINEMIRNMTYDKEDITTDKGLQMATDVLKFIRKRIQSFQEETGNLYNLEATPAEGTTYRFAREDRKRYRDILQAGTNEQPYYTNSSQLPVDYTTDPFEALNMQDNLQCLYTGGTVLHLYMDGAVTSKELCKVLVKRALSNYRLPYISVTPTHSVCPVHGYLSGKHEYCPKCDEEIISKYKS